MLRFTTNQGYEDIVANELNSLLAEKKIEPGTFQGSPFGVRGNVLYTHSGNEEELLPFVPRMRSIYHCVYYLKHAEYEDENFLSLIPPFVEDLHIPQLETSASFRVRCNRRGSHPFHSPEIERLAGGILQERYGTSVDLEEPETDVQLDIFGTHVFAGTRITAGRRDQRFDKAFHQRIATRSVVAYGMLNLSGILSKPGTILDPFCGSGTILLEAADNLPSIALYGCDIGEEAVEGTRENLRRLGAEERSQILQGDARNLSRHFPARSIDYIITDPPLGIRMGKRINYYALFSRLLEEAKTVLSPKGRILLLAARHRKLLNYAVRDTGGFRIAHVRVIEYGGIYPALFLLQKLE